LGGETWFRLGDKDLALHLRRRTLLNEGLTLTQATAAIAQALGIAHRILPMSDDPVRTKVLTPDGRLAFQHYFVRDRCAPTATGFEFDGAAAAQLNPAIRFDGVTRIVVCPSNPFVSVDPILAVPGMKEAMRRAGVPIIAVSPIVGGQALKGPTAKMMRELGVPATTQQVARHYQGLATHFVIDAVDAEAEPAVRALGMATAVAQTVMRTLADRIELARVVLDLPP
jgi:LPPG:FO 2-phospho-L-lactate transferase